MKTIRLPAENVAELEANLQRALEQLADVRGYKSADNVRIGATRAIVERALETIRRAA